MSLETQNIEVQVKILTEETQVVMEIDDPYIGALQKKYITRKKSRGDISMVEHTQLEELSSEATTTSELPQTSIHFLPVGIIRYLSLVFGPS